MDVVVVGGGPWAPDTNFPTHHTARILSRDHRVLYLCRASHVSLLGKAGGHLKDFHSWPELAGHVASLPKTEHVADNLWVSALAGPAAAVPLSYPPPARALSVRLVIQQLRWALRRLRFERPLLWFYWWFFPEIVTAVPHRLAVYDIYDDHAEYDYVRTNPRRQQYIRRLERHLISQVDMSFAVSRKLVRERDGGPPVHYLPNGADLAAARLAALQPEPEDLGPLPRPIVGYLGSYDSRMDWALVEEMVSARPGWSFVFVGGGTTRPSRDYPNLHLLGNRSYTVAMNYVKSFDVALIPFVRNALTDAICPAKLFDYLSLGRPVLSTPIPAISEIAGSRAIVYRGATAAEMIALAESALSEDPALAGERVALAESLTWDARAKRAMGWIEAAMQQGEAGE